MVSNYTRRMNSQRDSSLGTLLETKLYKPHILSNLIARPRLLKQMSENLEAPLTLICAPAGFGKTTLVLQWLRQLEQVQSGQVPSAWLSLDKHDNDPGVFLMYFTAAIRTLFPDACEATLAMLNLPEMPRLDAIITTLANELDHLPVSDLQQLSRPQLFILVLDDYHMVHNSAVDSLLATLLSHPPQGMHLAICSRQDPSLPLARLRGHRQLAEIRIKDLRFRSDEIAALLKQAVPADWTEAEITRIEEQTEGWIAGLHLTTLLLQDARDPRSLAAQRSPDYRFAMEFLLEEVLARQPFAIRQSLLKSSILDRFCAEACEAVCPESLASGRNFLDRLEKCNLFLIGLDDKRVWYRYHYLFRQFLQVQLRQQLSSDEIATLHRRASAWFASQGLIEEALSHALAAGDVEGAAQLIARHQHDLMNSEQWQRLDLWLHMLPSSAVDDYPDLLMTQARFEWLRRADLLSAAVLAERAEVRLAQLNIPPEDARIVQGDIDAVQSMVAYNSADGAKAIALALRALETLPRERYLVRSQAWIRLAASYQLMGEREQAYAALVEGQHEERIASDIRWNRVYAATCFLRWIEGNLDAILPVATNVIEAGRRGGLRETEAWGHYFMACVYYERNNLAAAEKEARVVFDEQPFGNYAIPASFATAILAFTFQAQNRPSQAREVVERGMRWAEEKRNPAHIGILRAVEAQLALRQGDLARVERWAAAEPSDLPLGPMPFFFSRELTLPKVLLARNTEVSRRQAADILSRLRTFLTSTHNTRFLIEVLAVQSLLYDAQENEQASQAALQEAVTLAQPGGYIRLFADLGPRMAGLLNKLGRRGIAPDYVADILIASVEQQTSFLHSEHTEFIEPLTERELEVLTLLAQRLSNKEIAQVLVIAPATVARHIIHIFQKLNVKSRREAITKAEALGIFRNDRPASSLPESVSGPFNFLDHHFHG